MRCWLIGTLTLAIGASCGGSDSTGASASTELTERETDERSSPEARAAQEVRAPTEGCAADSDCAPDHNCVPDVCVPRGLAVTDQVCEETGPPIGACACVEGRCDEVPYDAPNGRDRARRERGPRG